MEDINNSTLTTDNGLYQIKPETSRDEQMAFIDTLRSIQNTQNQEIQDATHALGTDTTPRYGGLNGTNSYWLKQYQTPQTEARIASLQSAAQSAALQTAMNNYLANLQEDYNQAYRRANKRSRSYRGSGGTTTTPTTTDTGLEMVVPESAEEAVVPDSLTVDTRKLPAGGNYTTVKNGQYTYTTDSSGKMVNTNDPAYTKASNGYYYNTSDWNGNTLWGWLTGAPKTREEYANNLATNEWLKNKAKK